jgi:hypothetical protein
MPKKVNYYTDTIVDDDDENYEPFATTSVLDVEDAIAREERYIQLYEAELSLLLLSNENDGASTSSTPATIVAPTGSVDDWFDIAVSWNEGHSTVQSDGTKLPVSYSDPSSSSSIVSKLFSLLAAEPSSASPPVVDHHLQNEDDVDDDTSTINNSIHNNSYNQRLQAAIRNFCFTSVELGDNSSSSSTVSDVATTTSQQSVFGPPACDDDTDNGGYDYILCGYFVINPNVRAKIHIRVGTTTSTTTAATTTPSMSMVPPRIAAGTTSVDPVDITYIHCQLVGVSTMDHELLDVVALNRQIIDVVQEVIACHYQHPYSHYLPTWITCMSEYLEFDAHRRTILLANNSEKQKNGLVSCLCNCYQQFTIQHTHHKSLIRIPVYQLQCQEPHRGKDGLDTKTYDDSDPDDTHVSSQSESARKPSYILTLVCSWRWKDRKVCLRLSHDNAAFDSSSGGGGLAKTPSSMILRQSDLDHFVTACNNDCWQALSLLLTHCSGCTCWKGCLDPSLYTANAQQSHKIPSTYLQDPLDDADDEGDDNDDEEEEQDGLECNKLVEIKDRKRRRESPKKKSLDDDEGNSYIENHDSDIAIEPTSPYRRSPSGRRRSDYEVQRLVRIERNEVKLSQLGLLQPSNSVHKSNHTMKRRTKKRRRISLPILSSSKSYRHELAPRSSPDHSKGALSEEGLFGKYEPQSRLKQPRPLIARPKTVRDKVWNEGTTNTTAIITASGFVQTENGNLLPKMPPSRTDDGTMYKRPRGAAPGGFNWDPILGMWVPIDHDDDDENSDEQHDISSMMYVSTAQSINDAHVELSVQNDIDRSSNDVRNHNVSLDRTADWTQQQRTFKGFRVTTDGCLLPKKNLKRDLDGISFKRPHGAAPSGFDWNPIRGLWEPSSTIEQKRDNIQGVTAESTYERLDKDTEREDSVFFNFPVITNSSDLVEQPTWKGFAVTDDGWLFPKKEVRRDLDDALFKRPHGAAPSGFGWNPIRGLWEPHVNTMPFVRSHSDSNRNANLGIERADSTPNILPVSLHESAVTGQHMWKGFVVTDDGSLLPKYEAQRDKNGSFFKRPRGAAPAGYNWNPTLAVWEPLVDLPEIHAKDVNDAVVDKRELPKLETKDETVKNEYTFERPRRVSRPRHHRYANLEVWDRGTTKETITASNIDGEFTTDKSDAPPNNTVEKQPMWKGFCVTSDGCLLPKKEPKRDTFNESLFKRPHGSAPHGFCWNSYRGVWERDGDSVANGHPPEVVSDTTVPSTAKASTGSVDINEKFVTDDAPPNNGGVILEHPVCVRLQLSSDGDLLPKKEPKRDALNSNLFKRPRGVAPGGFHWNPYRGVWEHDDKANTNRQPQEEIVSTSQISHNLKDGIITTFIEEKHATSDVDVPQNNASHIAEQGMWNGYIVTSNGCLYPKKEPKRETTDNSLLKRPRGAAPLGFQWNTRLGVWAPKVKSSNENTDATSKAADMSSSPLSLTVERSNNDHEDERLYPRRSLQAMSLQRYSPPSK